MKTAQILMHRPRSIKVELSKNVASDTPLLRGDWAAENEYRLSQSERNNSKWIALPLPISRWWMDVMSLSILRWLRKATALHAANLMFCGLSTTKLSFFRDRLWVHSQKWCGKKKAVKTTPEESSPMSVDLIRLLTIVPTLLDRGSLYEWSTSGNRHNHDMTSALSWLPKNTSGILSYGELRDGKGCFLLFEIACWLMKVQDLSLVRSWFWQHLHHIRLDCSSNRRICSRHANTNFHPTTAAELLPAICWHKLY